MTGFTDDITEDRIVQLQEMARLCRGDIIKMTTVAGSGHPGGSMSSIDIFLTLFSHARISVKTSSERDRDRIIVSHGHTAPGLYACLAHLGFIDREGLLACFRNANSPYEGHIERDVPGVEWTSGNLGQGLSAGCGFALAGRLNGLRYNTFVAMSDGEQAKGQVAEARRFARKYDLNDLTVIIDHNHIQISGRTEDVMPVNIKENYLADGWRVLETSGHHFKELYNVIRQALADRDHPYAIIAETIIGKGVSFMENRREYHGRALTEEECIKALGELGISGGINTITRARAACRPARPRNADVVFPSIDTGSPKTYDKDTHPRAVFGSVLAEIAERNPKLPIAVLDCDLAESVKSTEFAKVRPDGFFEAGVSEHTTATIAGALSINGIVTVWADFGVFAIDEVYNQLRLNDINCTNVKICATHLGYNVGPDGKTHHCIDYIGLLRNLFGFKLIVPGDPNQTDHAVRHVLQQKGNYVIGLGRTKLPVVRSTEGKIFFDGDYNYEYGRTDLVRKGDDCAILTFGAMLPMAIEVHEKLKATGIHPRVYNVSSPLSIDTRTIHEAARTKCIFTYEDHVVDTGLGSTVAQMLIREKLKTPLVPTGIEQYGKSDDPQVLYKNYGLDAESLVQRITANL
ncbi:MAG: transketolase [candidate division WOR-3 bacterium]|nr:MAG: transketolase [candidate division WOR-3 bacterium]